jgi:CubicO group peptidase (beta-lactamase class C family)
MIQGAVLTMRGDDVLADDRSAGCTPGTRFQLASVSKQFTAAAVLMLAERGRLSVDDRIGRWIGECPESWRDITLHHLMTHTSGLKHWRDHPTIDLTRPMNMADLVEEFRRVPPLFAPGASWYYSSPGYVLLALVAERTADEAYAELLGHQIFGPLGMERTFAGSPGDRPDIARGHGADGEPVASFELDVVNMGAGDVWSTTGDMLRWIDGLRAGRLLGEHYRTLMLTERVVTGRGPDERGYGYGFFTGAVAGEPWFHHGGDNAGFKSFVACLPRSDRRIVALSNSDATGAAALSSVVTAALD